MKSYGFSSSVSWINESSWTVRHGIRGFYRFRCNGNRYVIFSFENWKRAVVIQVRVLPCDHTLNSKTLENGRNSKVDTTRRNCSVSGEFDVCIPAQNDDTSTCPLRNENDRTRNRITQSTLRTCHAEKCTF